MILDAAEIERRINDSYEVPNAVAEAIPAPVVTVRTYTYQHAPYIRDCLEGVLAQKTTFPFEYIIGEDYSTDGTREIVLEYAQRYPQIIRVITAGYNVGGEANVQRCAQRTRGKYTALCDGDDYWIDPLKLQKQVDTLETHPEYGLTHSDCDFLYVRNNKMLHAFNKSLNIRASYTHQEDLFDQILAYSYRIRTPTVLYRTSLRNAIQKELVKIRGRFLMGDAPIWLEMAHLAQFHYFDQVFAVYRVLPESITHSANVATQLRFILSSAEMRVYFAQKYRADAPLWLKRRYNQALLMYKAIVPDYAEMYPLIQPSAMEVLFDKMRHPSTRFFIRLWFYMLSIKDAGVREAVKQCIQKTQQRTRKLVSRLA